MVLGRFLAICAGCSLCPQLVPSAAVGCPGTAVGQPVGPAPHRLGLFPASAALNKGAMNIPLGTVTAQAFIRLNQRPGRGCARVSSALGTERNHPTVSQGQVPFYRPPGPVRGPASGPGQCGVMLVPRGAIATGAWRHRAGVSSAISNGPLTRAPFCASWLVRCLFVSPARVRIGLSVWSPLGWNACLSRRLQPLWEERLATGPSHGVPVRLHCQQGRS